MAETQLTLGDRGEIMRGSVTVAQMVVTNSNHSRMVQDRALFLSAPDLVAAAEKALNFFVGIPVLKEARDVQAALEAAIARATGAAS